MEENLVVGRTPHVAEAHKTVIILDDGLGKEFS